MPKKTVQPEVKTAPVWDETAKAAHYEKVDIAVAAAMKSIPISGSAVDMLQWLKKNSSAGYRNLLKAAFQAAGL